MIMYFNEKRIEKIETKYQNGEKISRKDKIFYQMIPGTRKSNLAYTLNHQELEEYVKCKTDIFYFISKHINIKLYEYQKEIIKGYINNRFTINMASKETGMYRLYVIIFLHYITFNNDKNVLLIHNKAHNSVEQLNIFKEYYKELPFFLKGGVICWNQKLLSFDNGSSIRVSSSPITSISRTYHIAMINDFAYLNKIDDYLTNLIPTLFAQKDSKLIIHSTPNGFNNFMKLVQDAERTEGDPKKNNYNVSRTYWWDVTHRDEQWKQDKIDVVGIKSFHQDYELCFLIK